MYTEDKQYLRMTLNERIQHFLLLSSFITLVITGFALKFPEALWVRWFRSLIGEGAFDLRSITHKIAAVIMVLDTLYHVFYISFTARGKKLVKDLWFSKKDLPDLMGTIKYFMGKAKSKPAYGRFSYIEKMEYWAVVWGTVIMTITGGVLWFENTFLPVISNSGMDIATAIHYYEAILAALSIFVWHFYFVIYNPDVYPMNKAWFTGFLTEEEMEKEHPLELEEIKKQEEQEPIITDDKSKNNNTEKPEELVPVSDKSK
jgi:formate dehydrogenase gamma subunit